MQHSYWKFCLLVDPDVVPGGASRLGRDLAALGVSSAPHYIRRPAYDTAVFRAWRDHVVTARPYVAAGREPAPPPGSMRGTERALQRLLVLPWNERYVRADLTFLAESIRAVASSGFAEAVEADG